MISYSIYTSGPTLLTADTTIPGSIGIIHPVGSRTEVGDKLGLRGS